MVRARVPDQAGTTERRSETPPPERAQPVTQAQLIALQRTAGNQAVGQLLRSPATLTHAQEDELLALTLKHAAFRARESEQLIEGEKDKRKARERFRFAKEDLSAALDEALQLAQTTSGGRGLSGSADQFFGAAIGLLKLAKRRSWSGKAVQDKLSALNRRLQAHGYKFPMEEIDAGTTETPAEPGRRDLVRGAQLGIQAARGALAAGRKQLAAERKAGKEPAQLHGAGAAIAHLKEARLEADFIGSMELDDHRTIVTALLELGRDALPLLKDYARVADASALRDEINAFNRSIGVDPLMPFGTLTATSRQDAAAERLTALDAKRQAGGAWSQEDTKAQVAAEHEALEAADEALGKAKHPGGDRVDAADIMGRISADIDRIEGARSLGYTDAVAMLATQALDTPSNVDTFRRSLIGNLVWALSSFVPVVGVLAHSSRFAKLVAASTPGRLDSAIGAAAGVFGAMLAQYSGGGPSGGGDVSSQIDDLKKGLKEANSRFCDTRRAQSYISLSRLMDAEPPGPGDDRAAYLAALETALRHELFGEVFAKGLNDGPRPQHAKVEAEAKRQLLVAATAPFAGVTEKGGLERTTAAQDSDYAEKMVAAGEKAGSLQFEAYDLVGSRVEIAARELGCRVDVDPKAVNEKLAAGKPFELPISSWSWKSAGVSRSAGATGSFTRWSELHRDNRVWTEPKFTLSTELDGASVRDITALKIAPADLTRRTFHGKEIFQLDRVRFAAVGGEAFSGMFRGSKPPDTFDMVYSFAERS